MSLEYYCLLFLPHFGKFKNLRVARASSQFEPLILLRDLCATLILTYYTSEAVLVCGATSYEACLAFEIVVSDYPKQSVAVLFI